MHNDDKPPVDPAADPDQWRIAPGRGKQGATRWRVATRRDFWPVFVGSIASNCGTWFQTIAQSILVYRLTGSTLLVGVVNFSQFAAVLVLSPWAGSAADRVDRRRLIVITQVVAFLLTGLLAGITLAGSVTPTIVIGLVLCLSLTTAFANPALLALIPLLVVREELPTAIALNSLTFNIARGLGPIFGVVVVAQFGIGWAFAINSLSYLALAIGVVAVRPNLQAQTSGPAPSFRRSVRMIRGNGLLAAILAIGAAVALSADPVLTLAPGFATSIFHGSDTLSGYLVGSFGLGAMFGALGIVGRFRISWSAVAAAAAVMGAAIVGFGLSDTPVTAVLLLFSAGAAFLTTNTAVQTVLQLDVKDAQRGQVMALWSAAFLGMRPLGSLVDGVLASIVGLRLAAVLMAAPVLAAAGIAWHMRGHPMHSIH
jgi:predicted MFS family arabinose efflux permease